MINKMVKIIHVECYMLPSYNEYDLNTAFESDEIGSVYFLSGYVHDVKGHQNFSVYKINQNGDEINPTADNIITIRNVINAVRGVQLIHIDIRSE